MSSLSTYHHRKKEWQTLIQNPSTKRNATIVLKLWTEKRKLLGYAQKQIEATKLYNYSHIQRRLKPLPPLLELLNTKKSSEWTEAHIADLAEKVDDKRKWPERAIRAAIALRPKGAPRYAMIGCRLKNTVGKSVRFILPTDRDLFPPSAEGAAEDFYPREPSNVVSATNVSKTSHIKNNNNSITSKTMSAAAFSIQENNFIITKAVPTKAVLETSKIKNSNPIIIKAPPAAGVAKNKKKRRRSTKRKSNINVAPVAGLLPAERSLWTAPSRTCATNVTFTSSADLKAETVVPTFLTAYDWNSSVPFLCLTHHGLHPLQNDCTPTKVLPQEIPVLITENETTSSTVKRSDSEWTNLRLADLAAVLPNQNLWPKEAINAASALRPKHVPPWSRYKYRLQTSSGKNIRINLPRQKVNEQKSIA